MVKYNRPLPVRVTLLIVAILFVAFNGVLQALGGPGVSDDVVMALLGLVAVAIGGDTLRPSGMVRNGSSTPDTATLERLALEARRLRESRSSPANQPGGESRQSLDG